MRNVDAILDQMQGQVETVFGKLAQKYKRELAENPRGEWPLVATDALVRELAENPLGSSVHMASVDMASAATK